jgi:protein-glutamine gamma-glutamyltransferase
VRIVKKQWGIFILALVASLCILLLRLQGSSDRTWLLVETGLVWTVAAWFFGYRPSGHQPTSKTKRTSPESALGQPQSAQLKLGLGALLIALPWLSRTVQMTWLGGSGEATELVWLAMLQYAAIWQAAVSTTTRQDWLSFLMSCFLVLFGLATSDRAGMFQVVIPFAIMASWWLMAKYWDSIEDGFIASDSIPLLRMRVMILGGLALVAAIIVTFAARNPQNISNLIGFMPTSGGQQRGESWARQGVGDGDMLVAARDEAYTFGPVDSDLFMDSETPSMYDLVSEIYGEPTPRKRQYARAISLENQVDETKEEGTESKKNSREFSAHRRPNENSAAFQPKGTDSRAVLYVVGTTPLHLRLESFDHFEDNTWTQSDTLNLSRRQGLPALLEIAKKPWMVLQSYPGELVYPVRERIATKIIQFKSPRLLAPSQITHVHIDRIDQPDFFAWTADGQLMMPNREHVPQLTVVHQLLSIPQLHALRDPNHPMRHLAHQSSAHTLPTDWIQQYTQLPAQSQAVRELAQQCIQDAGLAVDSPRSTDWRRIEAIVHHMRSSFTHDANALPPDDCEDVIAHLLVNRRGPDYLIATATVAMVRTLGVPCRLCRGFFASPSRYDPKAGQTQVLPEDLHTWAEVYAHGLWLPIEPTGSYPIPREHRSWQQWAIQSLWSIRDSILRNPWTTVTAAVCGLLALALRQRILQLLLSSVFLLACWTPMPTRMRWTIRWLQWRMWIWGEKLPRRFTLETWLSSQLARHPSVSPQDHSTFIRTAQRLAYAPAHRRSHIPTSELDATYRVCRKVIGSGFYSALSRSPNTKPSI